MSMQTTFLIRLLLSSWIFQFKLIYKVIIKYNMYREYVK